MKHKKSLMFFVLGVFFAACGSNNNAGGGDSDTSTDSMTDESRDTNTASDSGADRDTDEDTDSSSEPSADGGVTSYEGFEEQYILTNADDPEDVCRVRYEVHAVGEPEVSCEVCEWDVLVEMSNPQVVLDLGGACANSDLALDDAAIASGAGRRVAYGFAREYVGHASILMRYNDASGQWEALTTANWNQSESTLKYNRRDGICSYLDAEDTDSSVSGICGMSGEATVFD